jgi:Ca2+-transporting ATPase
VREIECDPLTQVATSDVISSAHAFAAAVVARQLDVNIATGLTSQDVVERRLRYGANRLPGPPQRGIARAVFAQIANFLILLLLVAATIAVAVDELVQAGTILAIVVLTVALGFFEDWRAERAISTLQKMAAPEARVVRAGEIVVVRSEDLVPGDVVILDAGSAIPADLRLLETHMLLVNEASLTGESVAVEKEAEGVLPQATELADRRNSAFAGTAVAYGRGSGVVVAIGQETQIGRIARLTGELREVATPLQRDMASLSHALGAGALGIGLVVFVAGILHGLDVKDVALAAISLAVAAVPEGLPAVVVICLALGMQRMAKMNVLIRRLTAVETLGAATVIATDKTGTLTRGEMAVTSLQLAPGDELITVSGAGYAPRGEFQREDHPIDPLRESHLGILLTAAALCNDARVEEDDSGFRVVGDTTEGALAILAMKAGLSREQLEAEQPRIDEVPFSSERSRMTTIHGRGEGVIAYTKGAPETILQSCDRRRHGQAVIPLSSSDAGAMLSATLRMADMGLRVIAFAYRTAPANAAAERIEREMVFLGVAGIQDPPRDQSLAAIQACRDAGIRPVMVTGDHAATALAIGRQLQITTDDFPVVTGRQIDVMSETQLREAAQETTIFARTTADQKLRIVRALQRNGEVVAVTGDGVNDAPALHRADIGVAMGRAGTDVAKEAADMIVTDDNFASLVAAVGEGRRVYDNVRNFVVYLLGGNVGEILVLFIGISAGLPLPLLATQILFVNLVTDGPPALALAVEPADPESARVPPRRRGEPLLSSGVWATVIVRSLVIAAAALFAFALPYEVLNRDEESARSVALATLIVVHVLMAFTCRSLYTPTWRLDPLGNRPLIAGVTFSLVALIVILTVPPLQDAFETRRLEADEWAMVLVFSTAALLLIEGTKIWPWRIRR